MKRGFEFNFNPELKASVKNSSQYLKKKDSNIKANDTRIENISKEKESKINPSQNIMIIQNDSKEKETIPTREFMTPSNIQDLKQERGRSCQNSNNIRCFSCNESLKANKNLLFHCKAHIYCNVCITKPINPEKIRRECTKCFDELQTRCPKSNLRSQSKPFNQLDDSINKFSNTSVISHRELEISKLPNNRFNITGAQTPVSRYNEKIYQKNVFMPVHRVDHYQKEYYTNRINTSNLSTVKNSNLIYSRLSSKDSDQNQSILPVVPDCNNCRGKKQVKGFMCNHNFCSVCLTYSCCSNIYDFFLQHKVFSGIINYSFTYYCPISTCNSIISVPTAMIINNLKGFKTDTGICEKFKKFDGILIYFENNMRTAEKWIAFFDGFAFEFII